VLAGPAAFIEEAWQGKFLFGGAMRQAGIVAAAALYALDHHVERLADDHARARRLAEGLAAAGLAVDPDGVETNFVGIDVRPLGIEASEARRRVAGDGVLVGALRPGVLRAATYLGIEDEDVEQAVDAIPRALGALVRA
jgi:threonine aldolase